MERYYDYHIKIYKLGSERHIVYVFSQIWNLDFVDVYTYIFIFTYMYVYTWYMT